MNWARSVTASRFTISGITSPSGSFWEAEEFLSSLVSSSDVAIVGLTPQGTVASWNGAAEDLFGYRAEEMLGRDTELLCPRTAATSCSECSSE